MYYHHKILFHNKYQLAIETDEFLPKFCEKYFQTIQSVSISNNHDILTWILMKGYYGV